MSGVNLTTLAERIGVTKGRVSQYVGEGKLEGCYHGEGRARVFDVARCVDALNLRLDAGQMMGNGLETARHLEDLRNSREAADVAAAASNPDLIDLRDIEDDPAADDQSGWVTIVQKSNAIRARVAARKALRDEAKEAGQYVLASEVGVVVARHIADLVGSVETHLIKAGARRVADDLGVGYPEVRALLRDAWREHRAHEAKKASAIARAADLTEAEIAAEGEVSGI